MTRSLTDVERAALADAAQRPLRKYPAGWRWRVGGQVHPSRTIDNLVRDGHLRIWLLHGVRRMASPTRRAS